LAEKPDPSRNTFFTWSDFVDEFGREMRIASEVHERMAGDGLKHNGPVEFDFTFVSDETTKLERLGAFLLEHYPYSLEKIRRAEDVWELNGKTSALPGTEDNLIYWALDMAKRGYEFDAKFEAYGGEVDAEAKPLFAGKQGVDLIEHGRELYDRDDLSGAFFCFTQAIAVNGNDADAYYSRGVIKHVLHTWKSALRDYDKALELEPEFLKAMINRGALKDENGDYEGALRDYDRAIGLAGDKHLDQKQRAYFNRGNTKFNLKDKPGACGDWRKAKELGADYAQERIDQYCDG
jgi:tetratricopeptide (TPR) repeat protein